MLPYSQTFYRYKREPSSVSAITSTSRKSSFYRKTRWKNFLQVGEAIWANFSSEAGCRRGSGSEQLRIHLPGVIEICFHIKLTTGVNCLSTFINDNTSSKFRSCEGLRCCCWYIKTEKTQAMLIKISHDIFISCATVLTDWSCLGLCQTSLSIQWETSIFFFEHGEQRRLRSDFVEQWGKMENTTTFRMPCV